MKDPAIPKMAYTGFRCLILHAEEHPNAESAIAFIKARAEGKTWQLFEELEVRAKKAESSLQAYRDQHRESISQWQALEGRATAAEGELSILRPLLFHATEENDRLENQNRMLCSSREDWKALGTEARQNRCARRDWEDAHDLLDKAGVAMGTPSKGVHLIERLKVLIGQRDDARAACQGVSRHLSDVREVIYGAVGDSLAELAPAAAVAKVIGRLKEERDALLGSCGWLADVVIRDQGGTPDPTAWIARGKEFYREAIRRAERAEHQLDSRQEDGHGEKA